MATRSAQPTGRVRPVRSTLLLVEDSLPDALLTTEWLRDEESRAPVVIDAASITEARAVLAACRVDCVVLDLGLPDASGVGALAAIVETAPGIPVVVYSGRDDVLDLRLLDLGAADVLSKGQAGAELLRRHIRHAIAQAREESRA
jgi:CheY-like chemotaxis protein